MHVPEFLKSTQQGLEKYNDQMTINFARNANHNYRNLEALRQLMQKKNRIESSEDGKFQRKV